MLVKNAQNLMKAVIKTMQAAEAACMKVQHTHRLLLSQYLSTSPQGLKPPRDKEQKEAVDLANIWKHKLYYARRMELFHAPQGARGLRKLNRSHISTPSLVDVIQPKLAL